MWYPTLGKLLTGAGLFAIGVLVLWLVALVLTLSRRTALMWKLVTLIVLLALVIALASTIGRQMLIPPDASRWALYREWLAWWLPLALVLTVGVVYARRIARLHTIEVLNTGPHTLEIVQVDAPKTCVQFDKLEPSAASTVHRFVLTEPGPIELTVEVDGQRHTQRLIDLAEPDVGTHHRITCSGDTITIDRIGEASPSPSGRGPG
ncbi:MAG: hypothetical protein QM770_06685 [Tepidisphaeraceae bacterium]